MNNIKKIKKVKGFSQTSFFCIEMGMAFALKKFKNGAFKWDFEVILYMNFANSLMRDRRVCRKGSCLASWSKLCDLCLPVAGRHPSEWDSSSKLHLLVIL